MNETAALPFELERMLTRFVFEEARLLDQRQFADWLSLFAPEGLYWVPSEPGQISPTDTLSLFCERRPLLAVRIERLTHPNHFAQQPVTRTHHHVSGVLAQRSSQPGIDFEVHASLIVAESRADDQRWFAGRTTHHLRANPAASPHPFEILLKRVDLINCDAPHRILAVPF